MKQLLITGVLVGLASLTACAAPPIQRIAFGSCANQRKPQPIWEAVVAADADLFVLLGDNVYADTMDMKKMRGCYQQLADNKDYQRLIATDTKIIGTWDDHDYGKNDAGAEFPKKAQAQQILLDFLGEPADSKRRKQEGVYASYTFGPPDQRVQIILLDTRYHRDPLPRVKDWRKRKMTGPYPVGSGGDGTILGDTQWKWLAKQLKQPAKVRIIASSIQFVATQDGWEKWANFTAEHKRMLDLIKSSKANGVVFISGDRHFTELSKLDAQIGVGYPLYDITSSGLTETHASAAKRGNDKRVGQAHGVANFGLIEIDWAQADPLIKLQTHGQDSKPLVQHAVRLSELQMD